MNAVNFASTVSLGVVKHADYVSIHGNTGGQIDPATGRLVLGMYRERP